MAEDKTHLMSTALPSAVRHELLQALYHLPCAQEPAMGTKLHNFRVAGTLADYNDMIGYACDWVNAQAQLAKTHAKELWDLKADIAAVRRVFDWRHIEPSASAGQLVRDLMEVAFLGPSETKVSPEAAAKIEGAETPAEWRARVEMAGREFLAGLGIQ